jgi:hypothetical protein
MLRQHGMEKKLKIGGHHRQISLDFFYPSIPFLRVTLMFSNPGHRLKTLPNGYASGNEVKKF